MADGNRQLYSQATGLQFSQLLYPLFAGSFDYYAWF